MALKVVGWLEVAGEKLRMSFGGIAASNLLTASSNIFCQISSPSLKEGKKMLKVTFQGKILKQWKLHHSDLLLCLSYVSPLYHLCITYACANV